MDFKDIIGHEKAIDTLQRAIKNKTISHSYLFEGEEGIGKKMVAYAFSKTLLCKEQGHEPCNKCTSCMKFDSGNHPDFFLIEPEKDIIRKFEIENMISEMSTSPFESNKKVFVIDDSHKMNIESKNSLLKTLEEPPYYVNIILISSSPNSLLPTILSRVQNIKFYPIETSKVIEVLVNKYHKPEGEARFIAEFTKGALGKAIQLFEEEGFNEIREETIQIIDSLIKGNKAKAFSSMEFFNENKDKIYQILDIFLYWFRDLLIYKELGETNILVNKDKLEKLSKQSNMDFDKINDIIENIMETRENIRRNVNFQLAIETMLLSI